MDGRIATVLLTLVVPAALMVLTVYLFAMNPLAILALMAVMLGGMLYLLSYRESFEPNADAA